MQLIITYLTVAIGLVIIIFRVFKRMTSKNQSDCNCTECSLCDLKKEIIKKQSYKTR